MLKWVTGHCNRVAVSRNRYGVEKTVDTHKILINAIKFYVCLQEIWYRQNHVWSFMTKYLRFLCKFTRWSGETPTGNFSDVFLSWTKIMSVLIGWPHGKKMHVKEIYVIFIHLFDSEILGEIISVCSVSEHFVYETHFVARWLSSLTRTNLNID